jgi:transposase InsO family protein
VYGILSCADKTVDEGGTSLDAWRRRIVGWSMATTLATRLVLDALNMALAMRRPKGVIHHSDQGSQYTSIEFGHRCREAGVRPSMGSVGDACQIGRPAGRAWITTPVAIDAVAKLAIRLVAKQALAE